jgi:hypothetical protein
MRFELINFTASVHMHESWWGWMFDSIHDPLINFCGFNEAFVVRKKLSNSEFGFISFDEMLVLSGPKSNKALSKFVFFRSRLEVFSRLSQPFRIHHPFPFITMRSLSLKTSMGMSA